MLHNALGRDDETARRQGFAIAICYPKGTTLRALNEWPPELRERGFAVVPLTAVAKRLRQALTAG